MLVDRFLKKKEPFMPVARSERWQTLVTVIMLKGNVFQSTRVMIGLYICLVGIKF